MTPMLKSFPVNNSSIEKRKSHAQILFLAAALVAVLPVIYVCGRAEMMLKATSVLYAIDGDRPPRSLRIYVRIFGDRVNTQDVEIPGKNGPIAARIYTPHNHPNAPVMMFVHGMSTGGFRHPSITMLATSMATVGLQVITPDISSERQLLMRFDGVSDTDEVARWAYIKRKQPVSLMGISFSGGLVVTAAAQLRYAQCIKMVFCASGYNDIYRLGRFYLRHGEYGPDGQLDDLQPTPTGPLLMANQHMDEMVPRTICLS
jgi:hypothetical protein